MLADVVTPEVQTERKVNYPIAPFLVNRWSPRSMTGDPSWTKVSFRSVKPPVGRHRPSIANYGGSSSHDAKTRRSLRGFSVF